MATCEVMATCERCNIKFWRTYRGHGYRHICYGCVKDITPAPIVLWQGWRVN